MKCSFIAYPAEPEHKNVLEDFREPIGRKNGAGSADLWGTKKVKKKKEKPTPNKFSSTKWRWLAV